MKTIVETADGASALLINQLYSIAAGGDFWESGGQLSTGGSSTAIQLSVSSVTVNIGGETVTHGSQPVTHSPTSGEYRTDVIYADSAGVDVIEGVEMAKVPQDKQFPSIWQPAPDNGSLIQGVPLYVVHITPDDAASADIESWQWLDRRMNSQTFSPGEVAALLEGFDTDANGPVETTVANSLGFNGDTALAWQEGLSPTMFTETLAAGTEGMIRAFTVPGDKNFVLRRWGMRGQSGPGVDAELVLLTDPDDSGFTPERVLNGGRETLNTVYGSGEFAFQLRNTSPDIDSVLTGRVFWTTLPY